MNRLDFNGQRAAVTGAAEGIGRAIAERLLASGAAVALWDLNPDVLGETCDALAARGSVHGVTVDVTDPAAVEAAVADTQAALGAIDVLVNNAGIAGPNAVTWECPLDDWRQVMMMR